MPVLTKKFNNDLLTLNIHLPSTFSTAIHFQLTQYEGKPKVNETWMKLVGFNQTFLSFPSHAFCFG